MSNYSNFSGVNSLTYLNEEHRSLNNSLRASSDLEKQGSMLYEELETQKSLLGVKVFLILYKKSLLY